LATDPVASVAKSATTIPDGIVVEFVPDPFVLTKSPPYTEASATAIHITLIVIPAQSCGMRSASIH